jgi:hypothetical protein
MAATCTVSFTDLRGAVHSADVTADSLYEAAVLGIQVLRESAWVENPIGSSTRVVMRITAPAVTHELTVGQIRKWMESTAGSPAEKVKKAKLKLLLESRPGQKAEDGQ